MRSRLLTGAAAAKVARGSAAAEQRLRNVRRFMYVGYRAPGGGREHGVEAVRADFQPTPHLRSPEAPHAYSQSRRELCEQCGSRVNGDCWKSRDLPPVPPRKASAWPRRFTTSRPGPPLGTSERRGEMAVRGQGNGHDVD